MNKLTISQGLEAVGTVGLRCVEQGIDTRENVKAAILGYVHKNYVRVDMLQALEHAPISALELIHDTTGIAFEANAGKLRWLVAADAADTAQGA